MPDEIKKLNSRRIIPASNKSFHLEGPKPRMNELFFALEIFVQFIKGFRTVLPFLDLQDFRPSILIIKKAKKWESELPSWG